MTVQPEKQSPLRWVGSILAILGGALIGVFGARQFREAGTGHTYYEFIAVGIVFAATGIIIGIIIRCRRKQS
jgi:hypothetical protein